ncbi:hypothetical protein [Paenibacillus sp. H1-7]|uniref:hypothetical protein n=1 Tax=Paenibacillus sp. H1-7 TaxID=2282849 RepID=UPI001EF7858E|nr:hypothetical protein [Paenibacillus sp. H1-7]
MQPAMIMLILWGYSFFYLLVRSLMNEASITSMLNEVDNFLLPCAVLVIFSGFITQTEERLKDKIISASKLVVSLLSINACWTILGMVTDLTAINKLFWGGDTAINAATMGRYSGIFNQPAEAGTMYSIGIVLWLYIVDVVGLKTRHIFSLMLMIIGGLLTVSKVFLFGGLLLLLIGVVQTKTIRKRILKLLFLFSVLAVAPFYYLTQTWSGLNYLLRFLDFESSENIVNLLSAGRYGEGSQQSRFFSEIWSENPLIGKGFGHLVTYDSGFFHFFGNGGIIALVMYVVILLFFVSMSLKFAKLFNNSESKMFSRLTMLIILGSFGVPVLTLNRISVVLWVMVGLLLQYYWVQKKAVSPVTSTAKHKEKRGFAPQQIHS